MQKRPRAARDLATAARARRIGAYRRTSFPGITCRRSFDGRAGYPARRGDRADGTGGAARRRRLGRAAGHAHQVGPAREGRVVDFFTSMSGEIFDRLTAQGLLASIVDGEAARALCSSGSRRWPRATDWAWARCCSARARSRDPRRSSRSRCRFVHSRTADRLRDRRCAGVYPTVRDERRAAGRQ